MHRTKKVARNVGTTLVTQLLSWAITFVVTIYVPRYLGAEGVGKLTLAASYAATSGLVMGLVNGTVLVREIARDRGRLPGQLSNALAIRAPLAIAMCAGGALIARLPFLGYSRELQELFLLSMGIGVVTSYNDLLSSALRGLEEIPRVNAASIVDKVVSGIVMLYMVWRREPLLYVLSAGLLSSAISFVVLATGLKRYLTRLARPTWLDSIALLRASLPFVTTYLFITIYSNCDPMLLQRMSDIANVGWYGLAKRLGGTTLFVPVALATAMLPTLSRLYQEDRDAFDRVVKRFIGYMFLLVVPFAAVLIFAPGPLLNLLHMPASFHGAIPVVTILGFSIILWYVSQAAGTALIASDGQKVMSRATGAAALIAVPCCALSIWLTQRAFSNGAVGAILSDTIVELYLVVAYMRALPKGCVSARQLGVLLRSTLAAAPMIVPLYFVRTASRWGLLVAVPGLILFLPICYLLGCVSREDIDLVKSALGRKMGMAGNDAIEQAVALGAENMQDASLSEAVALKGQEQAAIVEANA
jgi:O-antigen/teichoic acid export membrane protein